MAYPTPTHSRTNDVENFLSRRITFNWEVAVYIAIFVIAVLTRFTNLGDRVMSHDESLHTRFSYNLYAEGDFQHTPLMHGPILFHMVALSYSLFGDSDFTARMYPAILGVLMVLSPLLFRHWLKRWGALMVSVGLLISPLLLYYNRYIREDTPAIMASILMIWAILSYLSGSSQVRYKPYWFYVLAFGMIWHLGTKETAFMYIAIIGIFLAVYWFVRLAQHRFHSRGQAFNGRRAFSLLTLGILLGGVMSMGLYIVLDIIQFDLISPEETTAFSVLAPNLQTSYLLWVTIIVLVALITAILTILWAYRNRTARVPVGQVAFLLGMTFATAFALVVFEELSHLTNITEATVVEPLRWSPLIFVWALSIIVTAFFLVFRRRTISKRGSDEEAIHSAGIWGYLDQFPEFDIMVVIGTLILPWAAALFPFAMNGTSEDFAAIGNNWGVLASMVKLLPNPASAGENIWSADQIGEVLLGFMAWLPLFITSLVIGLTWNWRKWLITAGIFYSIFAFFFTTMFTNLYGLMTGMYYSLGYWLEQQGVKRGSQPQYYYLLVIMPMYEFLPIIGSVLAMFAGLIAFWRRTATEDEAQQELEVQIAAEYANSNIMVEEDEEAPSDPSDLPNGEWVAAEQLAESGAQTYTLDTIERTHDLRSSQRLEEVPFLIFWAWIAVFNLIVFTWAGEKMPWLGTHLTFPLIFLSGWFVGKIVAKVDPIQFVRRGWIQVLVLCVLAIALIQVFGAFLLGSPPFAGLEVDRLRDTQSWIASVVVSIACVVGLIVLSTSWTATRRLITVAVFGILTVLTWRSAWMAAYVNYDEATEFLVYAHSAPAVKTVLDMIEDISLRTTDSNELVFAYDNLVSWPYSWYFRDFPKAVFVGENPTMQNLQDAVVVVVGDGNRGKVEPIVEDRYIRYDYVRMWWPMQEYFYLSADRVNNLLDFTPTNLQAAQIRRGIFDIWWNRDYKVYGEAINKDYSLPNWPVQNAMNIYVRKDVVSQIWNFGTGEGTVENPLDQLEQNQCNLNFQDLQPTQIIVAGQTSLARPLGMAFGADGNLYVAEETNSRISVFDPQGNYLRSVGMFGTAPNDLQFSRPNSITFDAQGNPLVVDTWNFRISKLTPDLSQVVAQWGQNEQSGFAVAVDPVDGFWGPRDVKVDAQGRVLVADTGNKRIRVYDLIDNVATWAFDIGTGGSGQGQLDEPSSIAIHPTDGRVFISDTWNRRVSVFTSNGEFLNTFPVRGWYQQLGNEPYMAIDAERNLIYVTDPDAGRVLVYTTNGDCVGSFGSLAGENPLPNQMVIAGGIVLDVEGNVYVSDAGLGRIVKFPPFPLAIMPLESFDDVPLLEVTQEVTAELPAESTPEATAAE